MSVRDTFLAVARAWADRQDDDVAPEFPVQLWDAARAEVLREADTRLAAMQLPEYLKGTLNAGSYKDAWLACRKVIEEMAGEKAAEYTPEYHCTCREDPTAGPAHSGHATWCPARKPTPERIAEIRQGIGDELTRDELSWLSGAAGRHELHITGARAGEWPMRDLPGAVLLLAQYLAATVAVIERSQPGPEEKASATAPTATPQPDEYAWVRCSGLHCANAERFTKALERGWTRGHMDTWQCPSCTADALTARQRRLLDAIRTAGPRQQWSTGPVEQLYRSWHIHTPRHEARRDLAHLAELGHLVTVGTDTGRRYRLNTRKDGDR